MPSRTQWIYYIICVLGLSLYFWAGSVQMSTATLPRDVAANTLSYPVRVGAKISSSPKELLFQLQGLGAGREVSIVQADGRIVTTRLVEQFSIIHRVSTYLSGFCFWAVCLVFFAPRPDRPANRDFFWASFFYGLAVMVGGVFHPAQPYDVSFVLPMLRVFAMALVMAFFVLLSLEFPNEHRWFHKPPFLRWLFAIPIAVALWYSLALALYLVQPSPERWAGIKIPSQLSRLVFVVYFVAGGTLFYQSGRRAERARERAQAKWILWGIGIGAVPFVFLFTLPQIFGQESWIRLEYTRLFSIACPLSFAVAVVRYQFLDIDVIIRRSLIYFCLAGVMVFIYMLIGVWVGGLIHTRIPEISRAVSIASVVVPVILFNATRLWIGRFVDRVFFKIRHTYNKAINTLQDRLQETLGQQQIVTVLHASLRQNLRPKQSAVLLRYQDQTYRSKHPRSNREQLVVDLAEWPSESGGLVAKRSSTSVPELETENFPDRYRQLGFSLGLPVAISEECEGLILLGEKESERRYVEPDLDFILAAVAKVRPVLERIVLVQRVAEETLARRQLTELNRLKSDFLSSVAHDIRTPLTSIHWSSQNLLDGVVGETNVDQRNYLQAIQASTSHLSRLVNNLLEISRLEVGGNEIAIEPVDLAEVANSVLLTLKPIADAKGVVFQMRPQSSSHRARANHGMTLEVVNNLLDNAIKFSPADSEVEIELTQQEEWCRLAVRDRGPGIHESDREVIFERFRQGRHASTGSQRGFGLGLFVVKSFIEAVDGKVWAENHPEGGARFICLLPAWPSENEKES